MKNHSLKFLTLIFAIFALGQQGQADPISDLNQKLSAGGSSEKAASLKDFSQYLTTVNGKVYQSQAIPIFVSNLNDADVNVRRAAIGGLLMISMTTLPIANPSSQPSNTPNIAAYPPAKAAILTATDDPNILVRQMALEIYAANYKLTPEVENKILAEINAPEPKNPGGPANHAALLESLMIGRSPSPHVTQFLTNMLDDPKYGSYVAERIGVDRCPLSGEALDKLATKLSQETDSSKRANYARAIGSYGKQAQQYTPQLRAALANEKDEVTKQNLQAALTRTQ
jgi:hypothetical protein